MTDHFKHIYANEAQRYDAMVGREDQRGNLFAVLNEIVTLGWQSAHSGIWCRHRTYDALALVPVGAYHGAGYVARDVGASPRIALHDRDAELVTCRW
jgi:hypothetical protein